MFSEYIFPMCQTDGGPCFQNQKCIVFLAMVKDMSNCLGFGTSLINVVVFPNKQRHGDDGMKYVGYFLNNSYLNPTHYRHFLSGGVNLVEHFILNKLNF